MPRRNSNVDQRRGEIHEASLRLPQGDEVLGVVSKLSGATRFVVSCSDSKQRTCIIPGRLKRAFWIKEHDVVLVRPWIVQGDTHGDIIWRYSMLDISKLKSMGRLNFNY